MKIEFHDNKDEDMNCDNCKLNMICIARTQLLCGKSYDAVKKICSDPDTYAVIKQGIRRVLATNCQHFREDD